MKQTERAIVLLASLPAMSIINGIVIRLLWLWFIVPVFEAPALTVAQAIGLTFLVRFALTSLNKATKEELEWSDVAAWLIYPLFALGIGWAIAQFV